MNWVKECCPSGRAIVHKRGNSNEVFIVDTSKNLVLSRCEDMEEGGSMQPMNETPKQVFGCELGEIPEED